MIDPSQFTPEGLEQQKQAAYHGMAAEYGITLEQARPAIERYEADVEKALAKYQKALTEALRVLQANMTRVSSQIKVGEDNGTGG